MRALTGAIITAAALIGLGLTAQGIGTRYEHFVVYKPAASEETASSSLRTDPDYDRSHVKIRDLDSAFKLCLYILVPAVLIGLAITFIGLAYHHHRRFHEHLRAHGPGMPTTHTHSPM
jgi:hypothetical protein